MLGSPAGPGGPTQRGGLWPLAPAPAPSAANFTADGFSKYGIYSLLPGGPTFGYSHSSIGRFATGAIQPSAGAAFHATHKDSLFTSAGYTFGAPTPPPGSPYSPVPVAQLEFLTKGFNSNIIIQHPTEYPTSPKKIQIEKRYEEVTKCCGKKVCCCRQASPKKFLDGSSGCSRTNPLDWSSVNVKKEPATPCQVAEITTSESPIVKVEVCSPTQKDAMATLPPVVTSNGNIPVGIAVARQRIQQNEVVSSPSLPPAGLLATVNTTHIKEVARISEIDAGMAAAAASAAGVTGVAGGGALLQCTDDRTAGFANWPVGGGHSSALAPTLWQYPAPVPMEPLVPMHVPMPPVGFQLVRDHNSGGLLLLPTTNVEQLQQTVVWPSYHQPSSHVLLPPFPPPPLQLLSSASSDYLQTSTTLHQHTQTHSTRLLAVTTDTKRKIPLPIPTTTLIKIETDDQSKTLQAVSTIAANTPTTVYTDQNMAPLVTTHVIYQHPTNLILSQTPETACRSQATSPVACLTPPPEATQEEETLVQDASNQTDTPECSEDDELPKQPEEPKELPKEEPIIDEPKEVSTLQEPKVEDTTVSVEEEHEEEVVKPDLSGLELLSNSIEEFEKLETQPKAQNEVVEGIAQMSLKDKENDDLGGLNLLCALAEQRILECEKAERKRKSLAHSDEPESKKPKEECPCQKLDCNCKEDSYKTYKTKESEEEVKKFLASKSQSLCCKGDWPCMNAMELDMRMRLADLQRKYREKQRELSKLKSKRHEKKRPRKKSTTPPPPLLDKIDPIKPNKSQELLKPPTLCPFETPQQKSSKKRKVGRPKKLLTSSGSQTVTETIVAKKPKKGSLVGYLLAAKEKLMHESTRSGTPPRFVDDTKKKSSKIRPKLKAEATLKVHSEEEEDVDARKKEEERSKPVSKEFSRKEFTWRDTPIKKDIRFRNFEEIDDVWRSPKKESKKKEVVEEVRVWKDLDFGSKKERSGKGIDSKRSEEGKSYEAKKYLDDKKYLDTSKYLDSSRFSESTKYNGKCSDKYYEVSKNPYSKYLDSKQSLDNKATYESNKDSRKKHHKRHSFDSGKNQDSEIEDESEDEILKEEDVIATSDNRNNQSVCEEEDFLEEENCEEDLSVNDVCDSDSVADSSKVDSRCILTTEHLAEDKLRVLTAMGGLFYAGRLHAVEPPDVYSITLDGERGNRPHIMSREEILRDAIVEVSPSSTEELPPGTRLCAYWSQQYRCLYPGSVAEPETDPDPALDSKFVSVEFDDGDSGRIAIEDIRLLPPDYPIIEYDPNPLLSLSKRRRRTSTTDDRRSVRSATPTPIPEPQKEIKTSTRDPDQDQQHKERKRLKKRKREKLRQKLLQRDDKKKRKKHRCSDEHCKHKKHHKKRRKHKKHHHRESKEVKHEVREVEVVGVEELPDYANPEDEVTMDDIIEAQNTKENKKIRDRQESCESRSKMSAFLPARQLWGWAGKGYKRPRAKGRSRKQFFRSIQRGKETITVGDSAVFLSTGRPDRPYIGRIEAMWESLGTMVVKVKWFYHPEETVGCPLNLKYPGALFESPHVDENDVQTISHKCEVLGLKDYTGKLGDDPRGYDTIYDNNDIYYLAGYYDPTSTTLKMEPEIPFN